MTVADFLLLHHERSILVQVSEQTADEFHFGGQTAVDFHETLVSRIENQRSFHVMENERRTRVRPKFRIWPESHGNEPSRLALALKVERFGENFQHAAFLLAVFALLSLLGSKLFGMAD